MIDIEENLENSLIHVSEKRESSHSFHGYMDKMSMLHSKR